MSPNSTVSTGKSTCFPQEVPWLWACQGQLFPNCTTPPDAFAPPPLYRTFSRNFADLAFLEMMKLPRNSFQGPAAFLFSSLSPCAIPAASFPANPFDLFQPGHMHLVF